MDDTLVGILPQNPVGAAVVFIVLRALAIVISPIPGIALDAPSIAAFGWQRAFIYAETGIMLGAMTAFSLARRFRAPLIKRFVPLQRIQEWESTLSDKEEFWAWVALRLPTNPAFDYISYAAGLTQCSPTKFFFSTLLGNLPSMFLFFYLGGIAFEQGAFLGLTLLSAVAIIALIAMSLFRKRKRQHAE